MIVHLYRYPHPTLPDVWLYVGQGPNRDQKHRSGMSSFGRRFKKRFPNVELPQPVRWEMEVSNALEKNEEETIAMFQYHTWWGYEGGMNVTLPGSADYKNMGTIGGRNQPREAKAKGGRIGGRIGSREAKAKGGSKGGHTQGRKNVESGHLAKIASSGGRKAVETGHLARVSSRGGRIQGLKNFENSVLAKALHIRWHINRNRPSPQCSFCVAS